MTVLRVFPRRTKATPNDPLARVGEPGMFEPAVDEIHVSVTFSWDLSHAEWLAHQWERVGQVKIGGPATGMAGSEFTPGMYLKPGYTITSRGCPNQCWFCSVWKREGNIWELPIKPGWNVLDDNLLACSEFHVRSVFKMLKRQKNPVEFTGGLEAARLKDWHVDLLLDLKPKQIFFAYDTPDDLEPLIIAGEKLSMFQHPHSHVLRCYVLIGYPNDTMSAAENRLQETIQAGFMPMAMLWRDRKGGYEREWRRFQRTWCIPAAIATKMRELEVG